MATKEIGARRRSRLVAVLVTFVLALAVLVLASQASSIWSSRSGSQVQQAVRISFTRATDPVPPGRIVFARWDENLGDTVTLTANTDGSDERQLLPGRASGNPHWSPDGTRIAVLTCLDPPTCETAVAIVDPVTGSMHGFPMPDPSIYTPCPIWSPDGARLACEGQSETDPSLNGLYSIRSSDGKDLTRITSNPGGTDSPIDYSPDGSQILFGRTDPSRPARGPADANQALFVANLDGSGIRRVTPWGFSDDDGGWSPDGTTIAFGHSGSLYTVHSDGTGLTKIQLAGATAHANAFDVAWSPDGSKIVFSLSLNSGPVDIYTANADGTDLQHVTNDPSREEKADWGSTPA